MSSELVANKTGFGFGFGSDFGKVVRFVVGPALAAIETVESSGVVVAVAVVAVAVVVVVVFVAWPALGCTESPSRAG